MAIITIRIDLAKNVFAVHGANQFGKPTLLGPNVKRDALLELIAKLPRCLIDMEVCSGVLKVTRAMRPARWICSATWLRE